MIILFTRRYLRTGLISGLSVVLSLPCTTKIVFSAYVGIADKLDLVERATGCCIVVVLLSHFR